MDFELIETPGLGDNSYLVCSEGQAAVIDPQRDVGRFLDAAASRGVAIRHVVETHVHNDYLSGALEVWEATGAAIAAPAGGGYVFDHRALSEGDEVAVGAVRLVAVATPGHTPEHLSYTLFEQGRDSPTAVFTGGSLMVEGAGRTDLLGADLAEELTRRQFHSLRRLADLPGEVLVLPTHGAGSFCGSGPAPDSRTSTIAQERDHNRALANLEEDEFVRQQLSGLLAYPVYYASMAPINRAGPPPLRTLAQPRPLTPAEVSELMEGRGGWVIDGRDRRAFAGAHLRGSLNVELDDDFAAYVGWVLPFGSELALILPEPQGDALEEARLQLLRVGFDRVVGHLEGGVAAWTAEGRDTGSYPTAAVADLCGAYARGASPAVVDVRQRTEWDEGHLAGATHVFVGDLPQRMGLLPPERDAGKPLWVACTTGHRASLAASLLDRAHMPVRLVAEGGVPDVLRQCADVAAG